MALVVCVGAAAAAGAVSVYPIPGSEVATPETQISFRGVAPAALGPISVTGSSSGVHAGRLSADSDGRGASFYPGHPFSAGEVVTVRTSLPIIGGQAGSFEFTVERPAPPFLASDHSPAPRRRGDVESFHSRPDLRPVAVRIRQAYSGASDIFLTPMRGPLQWGPMIVDRWGHLIWFLPLSGPTTTATNFAVQHYLGQPVLTWWQGFINGFGQGEDVILNSHYRRIATVRAGNGLTADLHEFTLTPEGTALITAYRPVDWDGSSVGAGGNLDVLDCTVQEIDIRTGNVLFQWDSLDHVPLRDSCMPVPKPGAGAFDYFHVNSIQQAADGNLIVSARNTWAVYKINHTTGAVMWTLGGKRSSFKMGPGTRTAFQHDAILHARRADDDLRRWSLARGASAVAGRARTAQHPRADRDAGQGDRSHAKGRGRHRGLGPAPLGRQCVRRLGPGGLLQPVRPARKADLRRALRRSAIELSRVRVLMARPAGNGAGVGRAPARQRRRHRVRQLEWSHRRRVVASARRPHAPVR